MLTVLMFTVGRGNDIFNNIVEDIFEKTDRTLNDVSFNFPAILTTILGTKVLSEVIFGDVCSLPLLENKYYYLNNNNVGIGRNILNNNVFNIMESSEEKGARLLDNVLLPYGQAICDIASPGVVFNGDIKECLPQLTNIDYCLLKLIFTSKNSNKRTKCNVNCQATGTGTWDLGPGTWDQGPETWDLGPETWDLGP